MMPRRALGNSFRRLSPLNTAFLPDTIVCHF